MADRVIRLLVTVSTRPGAAVPVSVDAGDTVGEFLVCLALPPLNLPSTATGWELVFDGRVLATNRTFGELFPTGDTPFAVLLRPAVSTPGAPPASAPAAPRVAPPPAVLPPAPAAAPPPVGEKADRAATGTGTVPAPRPAPPARRAAPPRDEEDDLDADAEFEETPARGRGGLSGVRKQKRAPAKSEQRRATVRYYSRMNPERVFPLLVMLTREEVEKVVKRHVEQAATGPLKLDADTPVEIEPVLPGCAVYPPKVVTRLGAADQSFTFHVVPHVVGDVTGARVFVRQDHAVLAEIALDVRVVQRTWVVVSGLSTVALPVASAAMKHFGLDFSPKDGGNLYLSLLDLLFGVVPPAVLMAVLAVATGVAWWMTRPKGRDVFFDISTKPAGG